MSTPQQRWNAKNADKLREISKRYRERHKARLLKERRDKYPARADSERSRQRAAYAKNIDAERQRAERRRIEDPDGLAAARRKWAAANREKTRVAARAWRLANPDEERARTKRWRSANPEKTKALWLARRVRESGALGRSGAVQLAARIAFYGGRCAYCSGPYEHIDHVIPLSRGGSNWPANLRPACAKCNLSKNAKKLQEWKR